MRRIYVVRYEENIDEVQFFGEELEFSTKEEAIACLKEKTQELKNRVNMDIYEIRVDTDEELEIRDKDGQGEYFHYLIEGRWIENEPIEVKTNIGTLIARERGDDDYPSIGIYLRKENGDEVLLSFVEQDKDTLRAILYRDSSSDEPTENLKFKI